MKSVLRFIPSVSAAIAAVVASVVCWHLVGELRWGLGFSVWAIEMPPSDRTAIYHSMSVLQGFATILGAFAVIWMFFAVQRKRNRWRVAVLFAYILSLQLALVP